MSTEPTIEQRISKLEWVIDGIIGKQTCSGTWTKHPECPSQPSIDARLPPAQLAKLERTEKQRLLDDIMDAMYDAWSEGAHNISPNWDASHTKKNREHIRERLKGML